MSIESDVAMFERIPMLRMLGRDALRVLAIGAESRYIDDGEVLFYAGDRSDGSYLVQEGSFRLRSGSAADEPEKTAEAGALLGELSLVTETIRPVTAIAREPSAVIRITRGLFLKMLESYPDAALKLRDQLAARVAEAEKDFEEMRAKLGSVERSDA